MLSFRVQYLLRCCGVPGRHHVWPSILLAMPVQVRDVSARRVLLNSDLTWASPLFGLHSSSATDNLLLCRWMQVQAHCQVCPVCKAGIEQSKVSVEGLQGFP